MAFNFSQTIGKDIKLVGRFVESPIAWDLQNPTLGGLKEALEQGSDIPIGIEIPDMFDGKYNPWFVAQILDSSNNEAYKGVEGVILIRKYAGNAQIWSSGTTLYDNSSINIFLQNTYFGKCSQALQEAVSDIEIPCVDQLGSQYYLKTKFFLPSMQEAGGNATGSASDFSPPKDSEGFYWDYWKTKLGDVVTNDARAGRIVYNDTTFVTTRWWTRSMSQNTSNNRQYIWISQDTGKLDRNVTSTNTFDSIVACFIAKPKTTHTVKLYPAMLGLPVQTVEVKDGETMDKPETPIDPTDRSSFAGWRKIGEDYRMVTFEPNKEGLEPYQVPVDTGDKLQKPNQPIDPSGEEKFAGWKKETEE